MGQTKEIKSFLKRKSFKEEDFDASQDKICIGFSSQSGFSLQHVDPIGETFWNNMNLHGGGKRTASQERDRKKRQRSKRDQEMSEEAKAISGLEGIN